LKEIEKNENEKKICRRDYRHKRKRFVKEKDLEKDWKKFWKKKKEKIEKKRLKEIEKKIENEKKICRRDYCNKRKIFVKEKGWKKD